MEDRLETALNAVIDNTSDDKVIQTLQAVLDLSQDLYTLDATDWEDYVRSDLFVGDMLAWFE